MQCNIIRTNKTENSDGIHKRSKDLEIKCLSEEMIEKLFESGFKSVESFVYNMTEELFLAIPGLTKTHYQQMRKSLYTNIKREVEGR